MPGPAGSCQHSRHTLQEGRAATPGPRHCSSQHACPAASPPCHPRVTLGRCTLLCSRARAGRWVPTLWSPRAVLSPPPCPPAPLGPHPASRIPRERLILGTGCAWCRRSSRDLARQGRQSVAFKGRAACCFLWSITAFGQGRSPPSSCPNRRGARGVLAARRTPAAAPGAKPRGCEVLQCTLDLLAHIPLGHGLGHLPSSGSTSWALGVCVMVKRVSEMSERKVSRSKCCLPSGSSSSSPSSMGTTLQKSWLHHFSVGLQTSSSCMRWSQGARWAPRGGGVRARLPAVLPGSSRAPHSIYCPRAPYLVPWCLRKGESSIPSAGHLIPLGLSHPGAVICPVRGSTLQPFSPPTLFPSGLTCFGLESSPSRADFRSWKEKTACVTPQPGGHRARQGQGQGRGGQHSGGA